MKHVMMLGSYGFQPLSARTAVLPCAPALYGRSPNRPDMTYRTTTRATFWITIDDGSTSRFGHSHE